MAEDWHLHLEMNILEDHKSGNTVRVHVFVGSIKVTTRSECKYRTRGFGVGECNNRHWKDGGMQHWESEGRGDATIRIGGEEGDWN